MQQVDSTTGGASGQGRQPRGQAYDHDVQSKVNGGEAHGLMAEPLAPRRGSRITARSLHEPFQTAPIIGAMHRRDGENGEDQCDLDEEHMAPLRIPQDWPRDTMRHRVERAGHEENDQRQRGGKGEAAPYLAGQTRALIVRQVSPQDGQHHHDQEKAARRPKR